MKRTVAALVSLALLAVLFARVDRAQLVRSFLETKPAWFALAIALFIPQIAAISWRWKRLVAPFASITMRESASLVLASQSMNLILPAKMGDLTKAYFLAKRGSLAFAPALNLVVFEKMLDVATLAAFMLAGVAFSLPDAGLPPAVKSGMAVAAALGIAATFAVATLYLIPLDRFAKRLSEASGGKRSGMMAKAERMIASGHDVMTALRSKGARLGRIVAWSVAIWVLHLAQIYCFFRSVSADASIQQFLAMTPLAIFIGLIPISIAGFGTRDHAFVVLFPQISDAVMASASMYVNLRYVLPALAGLPFVSRYLALKPISAETEPSGPLEQSSK